MPRMQGLSIALWSPPVLAVCCALDLPGSATRDPLALSALFALALALAVLHGASWEILFGLLARAPRRLAAAFWLVASASVAAWICGELGAFARLGGVYNGLARSILAGAVLGTPLLAGALYALQPSRLRPFGLLAGARGRVRMAGVAAFALVAAACHVADRTLYVGLYPGAHIALRVGCLSLGSFGLGVLARWPATRPVWPWSAFLLIGTLGVALAERDPAALSNVARRPWPALVIAAARELTDVDRDGYSAWFAGGDCAAFDPAVHPAAPELPDNGIDDNCLLGDARAVLPDRQRLALPQQPSPLDIVLITVDSLRADRVGAYCQRCGSVGLATTPNLDVFARGALVFEHAYTPGGWTSIAVSSLMRGVYPRRLDWTRTYETNRYRLVRSSERDTLLPGERTTKMFPLPLRDEHASIAHWLDQRGMRTIAVVDDEYTELLSRDSAVAPGFAVQREVDELPPGERDDAGTAQLAMRELASVPPGQRALLWVHFFGPHSPNRFHAGVRLDGPSLVQGYEHEIRYTDAQLGRLLRAIDARGVPTAVFITADHGEEFIEGGRHHGWSVRDEVLHVPFIARVPGWPSGRASVPISLVDLLPTILELTGMPIPAGLDGVPLSALLRAPPARTLLADTWRYSGDGRLLLAQSAALDATDKVVYQPLDGGWWRYAAGDSQPRTVSPDAPLPALRALAAYVESSNGPFRLHD